MNLFTGINGTGKSTLIQALLLTALQDSSHRMSEYEPGNLNLNGNYVELGSFSDVKNSSTLKTDPIEFNIIFAYPEGTPKLARLNYLLIEDSEDDRIAEIMFNEKCLDENGREGKNNEPFGYWNWTHLIGESIHYISANRIGPQDFYLRQSPPEDDNVGTRGEYTANILHLSKKRQQEVSPLLIAEQETPHTVLGQTEAWLRKIFNGGKIDIKNVETNILIMQMSSDDSSNLYKPLNIGFGYSYALPIIVSGLIAKKDGILIVENPEAHLHPNAQSQLAKFLATVSKSGVQVIVESHSDHILNGLRVAVLDKIITAADLNILYFQRDATKQVVKIPVTETGAIYDWPPGFFDQTNKDFERLFGV